MSAAVAIESASARPTTQKARGVWALHRQTILCAPKGLLLRDIPHDFVLPAKMTFARPCPRLPRHGFVESRSVSSRADLVRLLSAARAVDPEAELLLMPRIEASHSAVLVLESGLLSIGPKHDGATAGVKSIALPIVAGQVGPAWWLPELRKNGGIAEGEHCYLEAVYDGKVKPWVVQARSGPPIAQAVEWIPTESKVDRILRPTNDLLAWEKLLAEQRGAAGVVAWLPGGTLACHAAIHAVVAGIPFLTRSKVAVGDVIKPNVAAAASVSRSGILVGMTYAAGGVRSATRLQDALAILHNSARLSQSNYWSRLAGYGLGLLFRYGALACLGELRHYHNSEREREDVYAEWWGRSLPDLAASVAEQGERFLHKGKWDSGSYGGWPWFSAAVETSAIYRRLIHGDLPGAVVAANRLVHQTHNGSVPVLTKHVDLSILSRAASYPTLAALMAGPRLYQVAIGRPGRHVMKRCHHSFDVQTIDQYGQEISLTVNGHEWMGMKWTAQIKSILEMALEDQ